MRTPSALIAELASPDASSRGLRPRAEIPHGLSLHERFGRRSDAGRKQQLLRAGVLVSLPLNDDMPCAKSHRRTDHLLVATIE